MANTLKMTDRLDTLGIFNKTISFPTPLTLPKEGKMCLKVTKVQLSNRVPNVYDTTGVTTSYFNNTRVRIGTDLLGFITIKLEPGIYLQPTDFQNALNATINTLGWWLDPKIPGLIILWNFVVDKFVIKIDSSKLNPASGTQFYLDLRESTTSSQLYRTLGFLSTSYLDHDATYDAPNYPKLDTQGSSCLVCCSLMPSRIINNTFLPYAADIDLIPTYIPANYEWPSGNVGNDQMVYAGPRTIIQANIYCMTNAGLPMIFLYGDLRIDLLFYK